MPFTNTFDNTFPPDTQLANLLGDDIRKFKVDIQERMAAISGLDAAKPDFASDDQPTAWNGILFFATDTGKIYQFNNPSWTDVSGSFKTPAVKFNNSTPVALTGGVTGDLQTVTIPGATMSVGSEFHIYADIDVAYGGGAAGTTTFELLIGGTTAMVFFITAASGSFNMMFELHGVVTGASAESFMGSIISGKANTAGLVVGPGAGTAAEAIANPIVVKTKILGAYGAGTITGKLLLVDIL